MVGATGREQWAGRTLDTMYMSTQAVAASIAEGKGPTCAAGKESESWIALRSSPPRSEDRKRVSKMSYPGLGVSVCRCLQGGLNGRTSMRTERIAATTHVDAQGTRFAKEALQGMARQLAEAPSRSLVEHDVTIPPHGKGVAGRVVPLDDGEHASCWLKSRCGRPVR